MKINLVTGHEVRNATEAKIQGATHVVTVIDTPNQELCEIYGKVYGLKKYVQGIEGKYKHFGIVTINQHIKNQYS